MLPKNAIPDVLEAVKQDWKALLCASVYAMWCRLVLAHPCMRSVLPVVARLITLGELISKVDFDEKTQSAAAGQTQKLRALAKVRNA